MSREPPGLIRDPRLGLDCVSESRLTLTDYARAQMEELLRRGDLVPDDPDVRAMHALLEEVCDADDHDNDFQHKLWVFEQFNGLGVGEKMFLNAKHFLFVVDLKK